MSDSPKDINDPEKEAGEDSQPGSVAGKGWDILVGGKQNPYAAGGSDPFDLASAAAAAAASDVRANDAETDAILKTTAEQPAPGNVALPADAALDKGRGAEAPRDLGPMELASPGISDGVTVTPLGGPAAPSGPVVITEVRKPTTAPLNSSAIVEIGKPEAPQAPAMLPVFPPVTAGPSAPLGGGITEVTAPPTPVSPMSGLPKVSMPAARIVPAANLAAPVPFVPGLSIPAGAGGLISQIGVSDPFASQTDLPLKLVQQDLPPDPVLEKELITTARIDALWDEINQTYDLVINDVRGHFNTTEDAIGELAHARELLVSGTANFDEAEELVKQVEARLRLEEKVRQWASGRGTWLAAYLVIWLLVLVAGTIVTFVDRLETFALNAHVPEFLVSAWLPVLFGILGGVIGALWVLNKHITKKRDFDPIHTMWYVTNPFLGGALGVVTYFLVRGGGFILSSTGGGTFQVTDVTNVILCAISVIVGFNQNVLWSLVDRFLKAIIPETESDQVAATDAPSTKTSSSSGPSGSTSTSTSSGSSSSGASSSGGQ